jgi:hypothetical protein
MKIKYICEYCEEPIGELHLDDVDDERLGFHCLTEEERRDIIKIDEKNNAMTVMALCDGCIEMLGLHDEGYIPPGITFLN